MILLAFLIVTVPCYSCSIMLNYEIRGAISRQHMSLTTFPENDEENGRNKENGIEHGQLTRHVSHTKFLEQKLKENCRNIQTKECEKILEDLVFSHSRIKRESRRITDVIKKLDLRYCLDGFKVVHFNPETQLCCDGVYNKTTGNEECCGGEVIDNTEQFCCDENIQNRTEFYSCCGRFTYDARKQICCQGNLYSKSQGSLCCGNQIYNRETELCCFDNHKFHQSEGDACCGASVYNSTTHTCCQATIQQAFGQGNRNGECCKDRNYHAACYKCENNTILPLFNETTTLCCNGRIRDKKYGIDTVCCGRQVIHSMKHFCNDGKKMYTVTPEEKGMQTSTEDRKNSLSFWITNKPINTEITQSNFNPVLALIIACSVFVPLVFVIVLVCYIIKYRRRRKKLPKYPVEFSGNSLQCTINDEQSTFISRRYNNNNAYNEEDSREGTYSLLNTAEFNIADSDSFSGRYPFENRNLTDGHFVSNISKVDYIKVPNENDLMFYSKDSFTQTTPEKETNQRTIFGKPFEHHFMLGESNATAVMPNSDVKMTLPITVLKCNKIEVNCTSFTSIVSLRKKLGLTNDRSLASPIVEYSLTGYKQLGDYAVVLLPFIGNPDNLEVRKFESDEGLNTVVKSMKVSKQTKINEDLDVFYILKDSHVYVYTKSFSGFYCTTMKHRPLRLRCFLFGSYKRFVDPVRHEVRIMTYIADELMKFADFKERMFTNENAEGRVLKKEMLLKVPNGLVETDVIQFSVTPTESHCSQWIHKLHPGELNPIYDEIQRVELFHIAEKCKECEHCHLPEHDIPHSVEWYMTNVPGVTPSYTFQCIIDIDVIKVKDASKTSNRIVIDELQLRHEDRFQVEDTFNARNVQGLKEYVASLSPAERDGILTSLASKYNSTGRSVEEVFFKLQENFTPKYVLEAMATVLKEKQMFKQLDCLQAWGIIPCNFISTNIQPVFVDTEDAAVDPTHDTANISNDQSDNEITHTDTLHPEDNLTEDVRAKESHKNHIATSDATGSSDDLVRQELSQTANSFDDITTKEMAGITKIRGELSTHGRHLNSRDETSDTVVPIQENASLDETILKQK